MGQATKFFVILFVCHDDMRNEDTTCKCTCMYDGHGYGDDDDGDDDDGDDDDGDDDDGDDDQQ